MASTTRTHRRPLLAASVAAVVLLALTACGADEVAERGIEELIESESGGDVDIDLDSGEFSIESEDGSMTMDEDGNFVITDENGEVVVGDVDEDGGVNVESEDGSFSSSASGEFPDAWPESVPRPDDIEIFSSAAMSEDGTESVLITANVDSGFADRYSSQLEDAGFVVQSEFNQAGSTQLQLVNGDVVVSIGVFSDESSSQATISVITGAG